MNQQPLSNTRLTLGVLGGVAFLYALIFAYGAVA